MYNVKTLFFFIGIVFCLLPLCISCEKGPDVGLYKFAWTSDDGYRPFVVYRPDSSFIDTTHIIGTPFYDLSTHNLWCLDPSKLVLSHDADSSIEFRHIYPFYVHRPTGKTDTLYHGYYRLTATIDFGHVHRECFLARWIILECRLPGRILGYSHLYDESYNDIPIDDLGLASYTFEGQKRIFKSKNFDYWIINRLSTDLYGPFTVKQLVKQLKQLNIPLPVRLESSYFPYRKHYANGETYPFPDSLYDNPKAFSREYPHGDKVNAKIIVEKKKRNSN